MYGNPAGSFSSVPGDSTDSTPAAAGAGNPFVPAVDQCSGELVVSEGEGQLSVGFSIGLGLVEDTLMCSSIWFCQQYDGVRIGLAAAHHLRDFGRWRDSLPVSNADPINRLMFEFNQFAGSAVRGSRMDQWQDRHMQQLLQQLRAYVDAPPINNATRAAAVAHVNQLWDAAVENFRQTFCKATHAELHQLFNTAVQASGIGSLRGTLMQMVEMYSLSGAHVLPEQDVAVKKFLDLLAATPVHSGTAHNLWYALQGAHAGADSFTFRNLVEQLEQFAVEEDRASAAFILPLPTAAPLSQPRYPTPTTHLQQCPSFYSSPHYLAAAAVSTWLALHPKPVPAFTPLLIPMASALSIR